MPRHYFANARRVLWSRVDNQAMRIPFINSTNIRNENIKCLPKSKYLVQAQIGAGAA